MDTKHTQGEWFANNCTVTIKGTYAQIAACYPEKGSEMATNDIREMQANAKLIAAAPDLLAALKALLKSHYILTSDDSIESTPVEKIAEMAIAKATK